MNRPGTDPAAHQRRIQGKLATPSNGFSKSDCQGAPAGIDLAPGQCSALKSPKPLHERNGLRDPLSLWGKTGRANGPQMRREVTYNSGRLFLV